MSKPYDGLAPGSYIRDLPELHARERLYLFRNGIGVSVWKRTEPRLTAGYTVGIILDGEIVWCQGGATLRIAMRAFRRDAADNRGWGWRFDGRYVSYEALQTAYKKLCRRTIFP